MGNISDKENSFGGHYLQGQGHRQFLWVFVYIPFSNATLCCNNWNTFLQRTFNLVRMFVWVRSSSSLNMGSSGVCLSIHLSVHPHFLCAAITGILFYRELSNFVRMFVWARSWSSSNMGHLGSDCPSVHLSVHPSVHTFFVLR